MRTTTARRQKVDAAPVAEPKREKSRRKTPRGAKSAMVGETRPTQSLRTTGEPRQGPVELTPAGAQRGQTEEDALLLGDYNLHNG